MKKSVYSIPVFLPPLGPPRLLADPRQRLNRSSIVPSRLNLALDGVSPNAWVQNSLMAMPNKSQQFQD